MLVLAVFLSAAVAFVGVQAGPAKTPHSLVGRWTGSYRTFVHHPDGNEIGHARMELSITEQNDEFLHAYHEWILDPTHEGRPDIGGTEVRGGREELIGIESFDRRQIHFLETLDNGFFDVTVVGKNTLHGVYREHHHDEATVFRVVLKRSSD